MEISCVLAALFFWIGNVVRIVFYAQENNRNQWDWDEYTTLSPDYLQSEWEFRLSSQDLWFASSFFNAFAWIMFVFPIIQMAWVLSHRGTQAIMLNIGIMMLALGGTFTEWLSNLFLAGMVIASKKLVVEFNLDNWVRDDLGPMNEGLGWRVLEVNHIAGDGFVLFTDSFEWFCLWGIFVLTFCSVRIWRRDDTTSFGERWNGYTLFVAFFCLFEFILELLRFEGYKAFETSLLLLSALNRLVLIPVWIICLGFYLPRAIRKQFGDDHDPIAAELALAEHDTDDLGGKPDSSANFSIDDGDDVPSNPASPPPEAFARPQSAQ
jgi:hypothetical protein